MVVLQIIGSDARPEVGNVSGGRLTLLTADDATMHRPEKDRWLPIV